MKKLCVLLCLVTLWAGANVYANDPTDPVVPGISGDYLEVRTSDVWTGPCFANGEVNLTGKEAVIAWSVTQGAWEGVSLEGLQVVAVLRANVTLGDPFAGPLRAKSVLIVDKNATQEQSDALVSFARVMGGDLLKDVVWVRKAPVEIDVRSGSGFASLKAGEFVELRTRALNHHDMHCGNEAVYYPPLTSVATAKPAYALAHRFDGDGLGSTWSWPSKRSAFIGTFAR